MIDGDTAKVAEVEPDRVVRSEQAGPRRGLVPRESQTIANSDEEVHAAASGGARALGAESGARWRWAPQRGQQSRRVLREPRRSAHGKGAVHEMRRDI